MDLSKLNQLDPKLKETYERVMGTSARPTTAPPTQSVAPPQPQPIQPIQPSPIPQPFQPARPQPIAQSQPVQAQSIQIQRPQTQSIKKKNKMLPIFIALGFVFLIGYAFIWTKVFKLKLPFLPDLPF